MKPLKAISRSETNQRYLAGYLPDQKNSSLVRHYFGTLRLDTPEQVAAMNGLYEQMWLYYNLFQPVLHLKEKQVEPDGMVRIWDTAQTPYQRLRPPAS